MSAPSFDLTQLVSYFSTAHFQPSENLIYLAVMSIPHIYYFWIWTNPAQFTRLCKYDPVSTLANTAVLIKCLQYATAVWWFLNHGPVVNPLLNMKTFVLGAVCALFGQILNLSVYKTLGKAGVYYGSRLGQPCKWVTGFPFNTVPHPQYVGSVLTIWGITILMATQQHIEAGFITLQLVWTSYYYITGVFEQYL